MPGEVVHNQKHPQRWQLFGQRHLHRKPFLPALPLGPILLRSEAPSLRRLGGEDLSQLLLEPGVEHFVGGAPHPAYPHLARGRVEQGQKLCRSPAHVLVRSS